MPGEGSPEYGSTSRTRRLAPLSKEVAADLLAEAHRESLNQILGAFLSKAVP